MLAAQLLKYSHIAGDFSEVTRALDRRCYPHTGSGRLNWCVSSSPSLSVRLSIQDETLDIAQGVAHYHVDLLICSFNWESGGEHGPYGTLSYAYTNSVPEQHALYPSDQYMDTKCVMPVGQ